jgi:membrane protease YdiL (CAAX protease family)
MEQSTPDSMPENLLTRVPVYPSVDPGSSFERFLFDFRNESFQWSIATTVSLFVLMVAYPGMSLLGMEDDPLQMLKDGGQPILILTLVATIIFQWGFFVMNLVSSHFERTGLAGLGFTKFRWLHLLQGVAFLLTANLILQGVVLLFAQFGMNMPGELGLLIPDGPYGKVLWLAVAITAGVCEETAFRGYLMTRLRLLGKTGWIIPTVVSALVFGACHAYQGWTGFWVISIYGAMFSLLFIYTRSIWPCIVAHVLQDAGHLFFPG